MKKKFTDKTKELITQSMQMESNVIMLYPQVVINGTNKISVENHKGIVKYSPEIIVVNTILCALEISGKNMQIITLLSDEVIISGEISGVKYIL